MHEFPRKLILLEYSPRDRRVYVRAVWPDGKRERLAPIHEDNQQSYVCVFEGFDNMANGVGFAGLVPEGSERKP